MASFVPTHYQTLELDRSQIEVLDEDSESANQATVLVRASYRRLALKWHPDKGNHSNKKFQAICEAYTQVKSRDERMNYKNELGARAASSSFRSQSQTTITDLCVREESIETSLVEFKAFDFEEQFAEFIGRHGGEIRAGVKYTEFIAIPGNKGMMLSLGNPKKFCQSRSDLGFGWRQGGSPQGDFFTFKKVAIPDPAPAPSDELELYRLKMIVKHLKQHPHYRDTAVNVGKACPPLPGQYNCFSIRRSPMSSF